MKKKFKITLNGKKELEKELNELIGRRGHIADKIAEARDFGDLSENAEYDVAREEQGLIETRIAGIEDIITNADIIKSTDSSKVTLGSEVELKVGKKHVTYAIVGPVEADPLEGKISNESPIGVALMGKKSGDKIDITTIKGSVTYEILKIS